MTYLVPRLLPRLLPHLLPHLASNLVSLLVSRLVSRLVSLLVFRLVSRLVCTLVSRLVSRHVSRHALSFPYFPLSGIWGANPRRGRGNINSVLTVNHPLRASRYRGEPPEAWHHALFSSNSKFIF